VCRVGANYSDIDLSTAKKNTNCLLDTNQEVCREITHAIVVGCLRLVTSLLGETMVDARQAGCV
jgi:hypothetical protein